MLVTGFPAGTFQTNCWLVATAPGQEALVVDPGQDAVAGVAELRDVFGGLELAEPDDVRPLRDGEVLQLAGLALTVDHTPGHTPGHVTFRLPGGAEPPLLLAGDLYLLGLVAGPARSQR